MGEIMTEPTPPVPSGRRLSPFLWISGAGLWLIVGVLFVTLYFRDTKTAGANAQAGSAAARAQTTSGQPTAGGLVEPGAVWDAEGIADFTFTERSGKEVTKEDLLGKPWVVGFVFTRCAGPCPKVTSQMRRLQDQFEQDGRDVRLVTMTVDPDYDTPEVLTRYANAFKADEDRWLFLTGDKEAMYRYIEKNFKMPVQEMQGEDRKPGYEVLHTTNLLLVDSKGVVRGKYNALTPEEMAKLKVDLKKLES
jgi:protein SCO1